MLIAIWIISTAILGFHASKLKPDFEFENLFPVNDPDINFYEQHIAQFGYDNDFMMVIIEADPIFDSVFFKNITELKSQIETLDGTIQIVSPLDIVQLVSSPMGTLKIPIIHADSPARYHADSIKIFDHPFYQSFFGKSKQSLRIQIVHQHFTAPEEAKRYYTTLNTMLNEYPFDNYRLVGKVSAQEAFIHFIQKDFAVFIGIALVISLILLILIFRSLRSAMVPYLIAITSLIWLLGLMALTGQNITILGSLIPPIILFVSTSDAIHFINAYRKSTSPNQVEKMSNSIVKVFTPTLLTSITTAIGFFSLWTIDTAPVQSLGLFTGIGVVIAFGMTFLIGPVLIYNWQPKVQRVKTFKSYSIFILRKQKLILVGALVIIMGSLIGLYSLEVDAYLLDDLPDSSEVKNDFEYSEHEYFGYKPYEIAYWPTDSSKTIWDIEVMSQAQIIDEYLANEYVVGNLWSPVSALQYGNQAINGGVNTYYQNPAANDYTKAKRVIRPLLQQDATLSATVTVDNKYARIKGFIPELGSKETTDRNDRMMNYLKTSVDSTKLNFKITGTTYLIDKSHESISENLVKGLLMAILLVSLILGMYFKSFKVLMISLVPNILPLIITAGFMGLFDIPLKLTTSIIFAVSFGIAVDDTIHFISAYLNSTHKSGFYKINDAFKSAGSAILITSLIILGGFGIFLFSNFGATYYLGLFICLALASATVIDMTLLPLILNFLNKKEKG